MAKKRRDDHYIVPMPPERALERLRELASLGIHLESQGLDANQYEFRVQRLQPGRSGQPRVVDQVQGKLSRWEDDLTRVDPQLKDVALWKISLFYLVCLIFGLLLAALLAAATEGLVADFPRRSAIFFILYGVLFFLIQPQRLVFSGSADARLSEFVHGVLNGPYADPKNLYEHYFPGQPYWQQHMAELENRNHPQS